MRRKIGRVNDLGQVYTRKPLGGGGRDTATKVSVNKILCSGPRQDRIRVTLTGDGQDPMLGKIYLNSRVLIDIISDPAAIVMHFNLQHGPFCEKGFISW